MSEHLLTSLVDAVLFSFVGIVVFGIAFFILSKLTPFSLRKEIEVDQNSALGIVLGAIIIGLSLIISAAIHG